MQEKAAVKKEKLDIGIDEEICGVDSVRCDGCASRHYDGYATQHWYACPMGGNHGKGPLTIEEIEEKVEKCSGTPDSFCRNRIPCSVYRYCVEIRRKKGDKQ